MAGDSLDNLLDLEQKFYQEGYETGLADGHDAGMVEGKIFGIEKGCEKALEMGRLHGRARVWNHRLSSTSPSSTDAPEGGMSSSVQTTTNSREPLNLNGIESRLEPLAGNPRLRKHIELLLQITDGSTIARDNSDEAVAQFDERMTRATAKAKVISQIVGEPFIPTKSVQTGIEDSNGISARH